MSGKSSLRGAGLLFAQVLGAAWTLPNTLLGLLAGLAALVRGARGLLECLDLLDSPFVSAAAVRKGKLNEDLAHNLDVHRDDGHAAVVLN
jgi:hypothetical protein